MIPKLSGRVKREDEDPQTINLGLVGNIRIGEKGKTKGGKEYPKALDYFKVDAPPHLAKMFTQVYGEKPTRLLITFFSNDPAHSCNEFIELRDSAGKMYAVTDMFNLYVVEKTGDHSADFRLIPNADVEKAGGMEKSMQALARRTSTEWKHSLVLRFVLPQMKGVMGEWKLRTGGSASSIKNITNNWHTARTLVGNVQLLPFELSVAMVKSDKSGDSRRYPVINLQCNLSADAGNTLREAYKNSLDPWKIGGVLTEEVVLAIGSGSKE